MCPFSIFDPCRMHLPRLGSTLIPMMGENVNNNCASDSRKSPVTVPSMLDQAAAQTKREVLLPFPRLTTQKEIDAHREKLQQLKRKSVAAWLLLDTVTAGTRFWLNFVEHSFHQTEGQEAIQNQLRGWAHTTQPPDRIYLLAQTSADAPCYDITDYVQRCVEGDLSVADRLRGRTIFRLYQTETQGYDLLSSQGVGALAHQVLKRYIDEFPDLIQHSVTGFCCEFPTFLSPLKVPATSIPWSDALRETLDPEVLAHLPLVYYETYDSATIRSLLWERLTQQFTRVCVGGLRNFSRQWNLQFAISFPSTAKALEVDIATILKTADRPILNANKLNKPKPFLIAKQIASRRLLRPDRPFRDQGSPRFSAPIHRGESGSEQSRFESVDGSSQISLCRTDSHADRFIADSVLGFNSWIRNEEHSNSKVTSGANEAHYFSQFLSIGMPRRSVLVLSPIHSLWTKPDPKGWNWLVKEWGWLCQTIWELGYDFDIVSETALVEAEVDKSDHALRLNGGYYSSVLLPPCLALQEKTVEVLTRLVKARGGLIAVDPVPYLLNGRIGLDPYPLERLLYRRRTAILRGPTNEKVTALERLLRKQVKLPIQIYAKPDNTPTQTIVLQHRESADLDLFYLFNRGEGSIETLIEIQWESTVEEWDPTDGERNALSHWHADGKTYTQLSFDSGQGRFLVARRDVP